MLSFVAAIRKQRFLNQDFININSIEEYINCLPIDDEIIKILLDSREDFHKILLKYNLNINNFYALDIKDRILFDSAFVYVDDFIYGINPFIYSIEDFDSTMKRIRSLIDESNIKQKFILLPSTLRIEALINFTSNLSGEKKTELFKENYGRIDDSFEHLDKLFYQLLEKGNYSKEDFKNINCNIEDDYLTIYRGTHKNSTRVEKAHSWTTSFGVAIWFARRGEEGKVYRAKVKIEDIYYIDFNRKEDEILIDYKDLVDFTVL